MAATSFVFKDANDNTYTVPKKWCESWAVVRGYLESMDVTGDEEPFNLSDAYVNKENMERLLFWYQSFDPNPETNEVPAIGKVMVPTTEKNQYKNPVLQVLENINPFDNLLFANDYDLNLDDVEDINEVPVWRLREYTNENFREWGTQHILPLLEHKKRYLSYINFLCYIGAKVPLAIAGIFLAEKLKEARKTHSKEVFERLTNEEDDLWFANLPPATKENEDSDSEVED